jgi:hypothetical protein
MYARWVTYVNSHDIGCGRGHASAHDASVTTIATITTVTRSAAGRHEQSSF